MQIVLTERFQKDVNKLASEEKNQLFTILLKLPQAIKNLHSHQGIGLRKIHSSGIYEARIGLSLRIIFGLDKNTAILHRIGNHDEVKKYLKNL